MAEIFSFADVKENTFLSRMTAEEKINSGLLRQRKKELPTQPLSQRILESFEPLLFEGGTPMHGTWLESLAENSFPRDGKKVAFLSGVPPI